MAVKLRELAYILLQLVPPGKVTYYGSLARLLGTSPRAVGAMMRFNDNPVVVPCHRVVRASGNLGGYSPGGASFKKKLLMLEGVEFDGDRVAGRCIVDIEDLMDKGEPVAELEVARGRGGYILKVKPLV